MAKTKYASLGEFVKIVIPRQFLRCGYPLSIKDIMNQEFEEIEAACRRMVAALENRAAPEIHQATPDEWGSLLVAANPVSTTSATVHGMICAAIAAYRLEQRNFGGNMRAIVENDEFVPFSVGELWVVTEKRFVKTGKRYPSWSSEDDYEPGGLEGEQTHCVYTVKRNGVIAKILSKNCERLLPVSI
jgi:hypothetical protein